jgi:hypothetical protein
MALGVEDVELASVAFDQRGLDVVHAGRAAARLVQPA